MAAPVLRFLADENCDFAAVRVLRADGHDVVAVSEVTQRSVDRELIEQSARENRILITEDKDFGWLVSVSRQSLMVVRKRMSRGYGLPPFRGFYPASASRTSS